MDNVIEFDDKKNVEEQIEELESKLEKMKADKENKCEAAKKQLVDMIKITASKYCTATGVAEALRVLRFVYGEENVSLNKAFYLACRMADATEELAEKAEKLEPKDMDTLCEDFYNGNFCAEGDEDELAEEMMRIDLCRNVGGAAEDMVSFVKRVDEEIESTKKAIEDLKE